MSVLKILIFDIFKQIQSWYPKIWSFLYFMIEKFNKNATVEKWTKMLETDVLTSFVT